jgi:hypothetical protein
MVEHGPHADYANENARTGDSIALHQPVHHRERIAPSIL